MLILFQYSISCNTYMFRIAGLLISSSGSRIYLFTSNCAPSEIRTRTVMILSHRPLPVGLPGQYPIFFLRARQDSNLHRRFCRPSPKPIRTQTQIKNTDQTSHLSTHRGTSQMIYREMLSTSRQDGTRTHITIR